MKNNLKKNSELQIKITDNSDDKFYFQTKKIFFL